MKQGRLLGWWYVCIGLGFGALAVRNAVLGAPMWSIVLRSLIAVGFLVLGISSLRAPGAAGRN